MLDFFWLGLVLSLIPFLPFDSLLEFFHYIITFGWIKANNLKKKQLELVESLRQLSHISAQDEFAKWARIRRKVDALKKELSGIYIMFIF